MASATAALNNKLTDSKYDTALYVQLVKLSTPILFQHQRHPKAMAIKSKTGLVMIGRH